MNATDYRFYTQLTTLPFVDQIWLFGSHARGDNQERADIDLAVHEPRLWIGRKYKKIIDELVSSASATISAHR